MSNVQKENHYKDIRCKDILFPFLSGLGGTVIGGIFWCIIAIILKKESVFCGVIVGFLAGIGTYELARRRNLFIYRIIAGINTMLGVIFGKVIFFIYSSNTDKLVYKSEDARRFIDFISSFDIFALISIVGSIVISSVLVPRNYLGKIKIQDDFIR